MFTMVKASEVFPMRAPVKESERLGPEPQDTCFLSQLQSWMYIGQLKRFQPCVCMPQGVKSPSDSM